MAKKYAWVWLLALCVTVAWYSAQLDQSVIEQQGHSGFLSLLPALATLAICFATRNVILALFMGVVLGGLVTTQYNIIQAFHDITCINISKGDTLCLILICCTNPPVYQPWVEWLFEFI